MIPETYRTQYRAARQHKPLPDTIEAVAATIALESRQLPERLGEAFRFLRELKGDLYALKAERLAEIRSWRKPKTVPTVTEMLREIAAEMVDSPEIEEEPEVSDEIAAEFDSVYADR